MNEILEGDEFNHQLLKKADYAGNTAVHLAAVGPRPEILRDILMRGASVHARNRANNTPLYLAEKMGNHECVRLLKEAGAHLWEAESSAKTSEAGETVSHGFVEVNGEEAGVLPVESDASGSIAGGETEEETQHK